MSAVPDLLILLFVYAIAGFYAFTAYPWVDTGDRSTPGTLPGSERLGLSIVLGVLLLAIANNYLTALLGSVWTAVALLLAPAVGAGAVTVRGGWRRLAAELRPTLRRDLIASAVCGAFILSLAHKLFFWNSLTTLGLLHPDLPWHVGRVAQQAFQSTPGFQPLSPLAFPSPLPFVSLLADSLVSATFRYLPIELHAFNYSQVLFCWAIVLWTGVVLIAGSGFWRTLVVLVTALLALPILIWGLGRIGPIVLVFFSANPNSLIAWPVALAVAFHVHASFHRRASASLLFLALVPPASLLIKANQAPVFGFLQAAGFLTWVAFERRRSPLKCAVWLASAWAAMLLLTLWVGAWPLSPGGHPSYANLRYYASVAFPDQHSGRYWLRMLAAHVFTVAAIAALAVLIRSRFQPTRATTQAIVREVIIPVIVLSAAIAYVMAGWWWVTPSGLAEGEPMHVSIELMLWVSTVIVAGALCRAYDRAPGHHRLRGASLLVASVVSCLAAAGFAFGFWSMNFQPLNRGGLPLHRDYDIAIERRVRDSIRSYVPEGSCFWFRRRYVVSVGTEFDPDAVIAATGCPVINGRRWRGYLGDNRPDLFKRRTSIPVRWGRPFRLVEIGGPRTN